MYNTPQPPVPPAGQPSPVASPLPARRSGPNWWLIGGLGCAGLFLLFIIILAATVFLTFFIGMRQGPSAVPADFPVYPGAALMMAVGNQRLGLSAEWTVDAPIESVEAFYHERLSQSPWEIAGPVTSSRGWQFQRTQGQPMRGEVLLAKQDTQTVIELVLIRAG